MASVIEKCPLLAGWKRGAKKKKCLAEASCHQALRILTTLSQWCLISAGAICFPYGSHYRAMQGPQLSMHSLAHCRGILAFALKAAWKDAMGQSRFNASPLIWYKFGAGRWHQEKGERGKE